MRSSPSLFRKGQGRRHRILSIPVQNEACSSRTPDQPARYARSSPAIRKLLESVANVLPALRKGPAAARLLPSVSVRAEARATRGTAWPVAPSSGLACPTAQLRPEREAHKRQGRAG